MTGSRGSTPTTARSPPTAGVEVPDLDTLRERNWVKLPIRDDGPNRTYFAPFREDPEAHPLGTPSGRIEIFSETIDGVRLRRLPRPSGLAAPVGMARRRHRLGPAPPRLAAARRQAAQSARKRACRCRGGASRNAGHPPEDAAARGISDGDLLRVFNARGACRARASVSDSVLSGVVALPTGAWFGDPGGNIDPTAIRTC
jgi:biotin/methionine sulfoxide reductase